jgi:acetaldehyde dehydrogenase (acetylating)
MSERSVSDLVFRDLELAAAARRTDAEREAALREELVKLRPADSGPRVIPAAREPDHERPR